MRFSADIEERIRAVVDVPAPRSVAVFDFDNTCIRGDIGELFGAWLVDKMAYRYDLPIFWELIDRRDGRDELREMVTQLCAIGEDDEARDALYRAYRAEMAAIYPRMLLREGKAAAYSWVVRLLVGQRVDELAEMSHSCVMREWSRPLAEDVLTTNRGERLVVETGIRPFRAIRETMHLLEAAGWEVWIVSATNAWTVEVAAALLFGVDPERVVGNRVETEGDELTDLLIEPALFRQGEVDAIERDIGIRPRIVFGDSETDLSMLECASDLAVLIDGGDLDLRATADRAGWAVQPRDELHWIEAS